MLTLHVFGKLNRHTHANLQKEATDQLITNVIFMGTARQAPDRLAQKLEVAKVNRKITVIPANAPVIWMSRLKTIFVNVILHVHQVRHGTVILTDAKEMSLFAVR